MRFPWLQVDADFIAAHAGDLGALLGISRREAMGLVLDLWTWALARAPDDRAPDGFISGAGTVPDRLLAGSVGWTGDTQRFVEALLEVGLLRTEPDGYRLTGFDRYKSTWEKNRRRTGKKPDGNRTGTGGEPARKTQTQTQTHIESSASQETAPAAPVADDIPQAADEDVQEADARPALVLVAQKPEKLARKPSKAEELYANFQAQRRERCEEAGVHWLDDGWKPQRVNAALGPLVRLDEAGKQSVADGWEAYLADDAGAVKDPPWSLGYFLASRSSWESRAARRAP